MKHFRDRGYFANYCRKIIRSKVLASKFSKLPTYHVININEAIWYAWENQLIEEMIDVLSAIPCEDKNKLFNKHLRDILDRFK